MRNVLCWLLNCRVTVLWRLEHCSLQSSSMEIAFVVKKQCSCMYMHIGLSLCEWKTPKAYHNAVNVHSTSTLNCHLLANKSSQLNFQPENCNMIFRMPFQNESSQGYSGWFIHSAASSSFSSYFPLLSHVNNDTFNLISLE